LLDCLRDMASQFSALAAQLAALPADVSPYNFLRQTVRSSMWFTFDESFYRCLIVCAVLYAVTLGFCVRCLIL
jgi:hypothetical protein